MPKETAGEAGSPGRNPGIGGSNVAIRPLRSPWPVSWWRSSRRYSTVRGIADSGFRFPDESRHALSGVFLMDGVAGGAWRDPISFASEYYARYPGLVIPLYYPPLFHAARGPLFRPLRHFDRRRGTPYSWSTSSRL